MKKLPLFVIEFIAKSIDKNFIDRLIKFMYDPQCGITEKEWLHSYIKTILIDTFGYETSEVPDSRDIRYSHYKKRVSSKRYWLKSFIAEVKEPNNPVEQEIASWNMLSEQLKASNANFNIKEEERKLFGVDDISELFDLRVQHVEEWAKNTESHLTEFRYLSFKKKFQVEKAFETDLIFIISNIIIDEFDGDLLKSIDESPYGLIDNPLFSDKAIKMKLQSDIDAETKTEIYYSDYDMDDDHLLRTIIKLEEGDTIHANKNIIKTLDKVDREIILHVLRQRDEVFYTDRTISVDIGSLVSKFYTSKSIKSYQAIEEKLEKIKSFEFQAIIKKKSEKFRDGKAKWSIFDTLYINTDDNGRRYAEITIGTYFHQQFINDQTVKIYSNVLESIEGNVSKILVHALQKERLERHLQNKPLTDIFRHQYFSRKIRLDKRKIDANIKMIESSLQEFKQLNILIHDYKRIDKAFQISFIPLSNTEIHDFFEHDNTPIQLSLPLPEQYIEG